MPCILSIPKRQSENVKCIVLLHGLGSNKQQHIPEMEKMAQEWHRDETLVFVSIDAPMHGLRFSQQFIDDFQNNSNQSDRDIKLCNLALIAADELVSLLPLLANELPKHLGWKCSVEFGLWGVSFGAITSYSLLVKSNVPIRAACLLLGSPTWPNNPSPSLLEVEPMRHVDNVSKHTALLAINASLDNLIPLGPAQEFVKAMQSTHKTAMYVEYPDSGHEMRGEDWWDAISKCGEWFSNHF